MATTPTTPTAPPTAAPPNFYDALPPGGDAMAGGPAAQPQESDVDGDIIQGLAGMYRVAKKMAKLDKTIKAGLDDIKEKIKTIYAARFKKNPKDLDSGDDSSDAGAAPADKGTPAGGPAAPPSQTDESHAA